MPTHLHTLSNFGFTIPAPMGLYASITSKTVSNTTSEVSALDISHLPGLPSIPANTLRVGSVINFRGAGVYSKPSLFSGTANVKAKLGSAVVSIDAGSLLTSIVGTVTNQAFEFDTSFLIRSIGPTAKMVSIGGFDFSTGSNGDRKFADLVNGGNELTFDSTVANVLDVTIQWSVASTSRTVTVSGSMITLKM